MKERSYKIAIIPFTSTATWMSDCNNLTFWNQGTTNVLINGLMTIQPRESITFPGYPGERLTQAFDITFPGGTSNGNNLIIVMKEYHES